MRLEKRQDCHKVDFDTDDEAIKTPPKKRYIRVPQQAIPPQPSASSTDPSPIMEAQRIPDTHTVMAQGTEISYDPAYSSTDAAPKRNPRKRNNQHSAVVPHFLDWVREDGPGKRIKS